MFIAIALFITAAGSFVAGALYGRKLAARAAADASALADAANNEAKKL